jgi:hypothetical protein
MIPARNPQEATMSEIDSETQNELERLRAENEALKAKQTRQLRLQVSQKGAVSLYGIRRFPITFYAEEWEIVLGMANEVHSFIKEHEGELKRR